MNIQDYISSGIVESYVLGLADEAERVQFESLCASHDEVRAAREAFELALEKQALAGSVMPPAHVKKEILIQLGMENRVASDNNLKDNIHNAEIDRADSDETVPSKTVPDKTGTGFDLHSPHQAKIVRSSGWSRYLAAASIALLVGSTILNFYLFRQYKDYSERYSGLLASQTELANNNRNLQTSLDEYRNTLAHLKNPAMSVIKMAGNLVPKNGSPDPTSMATIYWNKTSTEVYLMINNLPKNSSGKQYQLWAIVNGKPVSAGVFDMNENDPVMKMSNVSGAQAFAVTLEEKGGSESPKGAMYVLGSI